MSEVEQIDEDALFEGAVSDEPASPPEPETTIEEPEPQTEEPAAELTPETARPPVDDNAAQVPSWRVREINEEKRALAEKVAALEARLQQQLPPQPQAAPAEQPARPDPLLDPEGYAKAIREEVRQEALAERREESLLRAREANAKEFDEAYAAARQTVDPALKARMQTSRDPGKTLLEWHRENKVRAEVGSDPNAWLEKKLEERLKDPAFLAKAVEQARGLAQPQSNGRPRVDLPPSLSGASRSAAALRSVNDDVSDDALFDQITG